MKLQYRIIGKRRRHRVRKIARAAWIDSRRNADQAKRMAELQILDQSCGIMTNLLIEIATKLAFELIQHWLKQSVASPNELYQSGEPGFDGCNPPPPPAEGDFVE